MPRISFLEIIGVSDYLKQDSTLVEVADCMVLRQKMTEKVILSLGVLSKKALNF